jgi:hypothetical protein
MLLGGPQFISYKKSAAKTLQEKKEENTGPSDQTGFL